MKSELLTVVDGSPGAIPISTVEIFTVCCLRIVCGLGNDWKSRVNHRCRF